MSTLRTTNLKHESSSSNNIVLDDTGKVSIATGKLYCPGVLIKKSYYEIARQTPSGGAFPADDTAPQITEGDQIFSQAYTPSTSSCDLYINTWFHAGEASNISNSVHGALFISGTNDALQVCSCPAEYWGGSDRQVNGSIQFIYKMASWGTTEKTFSIRVSGCNAINYHYVGEFATAQFSANACKSGFTIEEIAT
tara:strand:- start:3 stop:587 length:585 start_codon:yes stop_codon:yes gene_type:complete